MAVVSEFACVPTFDRLDKPTREFAHKAVVRRDTQAAKSALMTMAYIGMRYADVRRDSIVLVPDFSGPMPIGVSDIRQVLNPIYESIKNVCQEAARQPNEGVVVACIHELGMMAARACQMPPNGRSFLKPIRQEQVVIPGSADKNPLAEDRAAFEHPAGRSYLAAAGRPARSGPVAQPSPRNANLIRGLVAVAEDTPEETSSAK
jgi:hypothetical protein